MHSRYREKIGFFEAALGLLISPRDTSAALIDEGRPRYALTILFAAMLTLWMPAIAQSYRFGFALFKSGSLTLVSFLGIMSFLIFLVLEALLLHSFRREASPSITFACIAYSCVPAILVTWIVYLANLVFSGSLTLMTRLILGFGELGAEFVQTLPYLLAFGALTVAAVFLGTLRGAAELGGIAALLVTALSVLPLGLSIIISMVLSEALRTGAVQLLLSITGQL